MTSICVIKQKEKNRGEKKEQKEAHSQISIFKNRHSSIFSILMLMLFGIFHFSFFSFFLMMNVLSNMKSKNERKEKKTSSQSRRNIKLKKKSSLMM